MKRATAILMVFMIFMGTLVWGAGNTEEGVQITELTEPVSIQVWYSLGAKYSAPLEVIIDKFNASQKMITVEGVYQGGYATTQEKLLAAYVAGEPPVLSQLEQSLVGSFVANDALVPLDSFMKADKDFDTKDFNKDITQGATYNKKLYGLPINVSTPVLYTNRDLFRKAGLDPDKYPTTWDEAYDIAKKISDLGSDVYGLRIYNSGWIMDSLFHQFGGTIFNKDNTKCLVNSKEIKNAMGFWKKMVDDGIAIYQGGKDGSTMDASGVVGMVMRSTGSIAWFKDNVTFDWGVAPFTLGKTKAVSLGGGNIYMIKKTTPEEQFAAWEFLQYLTNTENQIYWSTNTGYMVSRKSAKESSEIQSIFKDDPRYSVTYDQLKDAFARPTVEAWPEIEDLIQEAMTKIILEGASVDILDQTASDIDELL
ncbi:MAG: hypothetical protein DRP58_05855 [Spirochaetes bacterium]|nr:MAG: hypothetical protein DRP58_05855 [Spirochaetota bacterium]